jgi:cytochrome c-type biogenesis protein CcsB
MEKLSGYAFIAAILSTGLATIFYFMYAVSGLRAARMQTAGGPANAGAMGFISGPRTAAIGRYATMLGWLAVFALLACMVFRTIATGHGPFSNMYEFSIAFAWGTLAAYLVVERRYHLRTIGLIALPVAFLLLFYATMIPSTADPLMPALQNNLLLTVHVAVAIVAYGSFTVAFGAALLYLIQPPEGRRGLPRLEVLDEVSYRAVVIGFPFLTLTLILGALWAEVAWGRYWGWDPKETASLVTWLIYGAAAGTAGDRRSCSWSASRRRSSRTSGTCSSAGSTATPASTEPGRKRAMESTLQPGPGVAASAQTGRGAAPAAAAPRHRARTIVIMAATAGLILAAAALTNRPAAAGSGVTPVNLAGVPTGPAPIVGQTAPDFTATTIDGETVQLSTLRGKVVWLTFGASWCQPCRSENPDIKATSEAFADRGVVVVQVYINEDARSVSDYAARLGLGYAKVADITDSIASNYRILGIPAHFFIDREGILRELRVGTLDAASMQAVLSGLAG